jgi:hypothetical protein
LHKEKEKGREGERKGELKVGNGLCTRPNWDFMNEESKDMPIKR